MPKKKSKKLKRIKQTLANGKTQILTIENGIVIKKTTVRQRKKSAKSIMNIFDPKLQVDML